MHTPAQIAQAFVESGVNKSKTPLPRLFLLAILAGIFIALAGVGSTLASSVAGKLAGTCVFPAGLAMVILAGSELFTGNNLMIISLLEKKVSSKKLLLVLLLVYLGNLFGAVLIALLASLGGILGSMSEAVVSTAANKASLGFLPALIRGVLCNLLVCVAVWMATAAKEPAGKILCVFFPIMVFVLCGYEHCVANMYYLPAGLLTAARSGISAAGLSLGSALLNLLAVTLGNLLGGLSLGTLYWRIYLYKSKR